ncbi:hypothetical protein ACI8AF_05830 [Blastococcus sp. SYSU D00669]
MLLLVGAATIIEAHDDGRRRMDLAEVARTWRPEPTADEQVLDPAVGAAVAGTWDQPAPGDLVPLLWHWFHFLEWTVQSRVGADGHVADGTYLPPLADRRRMVAGGSVRQAAPLRYGEPAVRHRRLLAATPKRGRSGDLLFVTVRSELRQGGRLCVVEDADVVYRSGPGSTDARGTVLATTEPDVDGEVLPLRTDPPLLFRMSALTGNQHRIHYDAPYAVEVEHYAGLVVHGPLLVLHMAELLRRSPAGPPSSLEYRLRAPAFAGEPLAAVAEPGADGATQLRVASAREPAHATATARWEVQPL